MTYLNKSLAALTLAALSLQGTLALAQNPPNLPQLPTNGLPSGKADVRRIHRKPSPSHNLSRLKVDSRLANSPACKATWLRISKRP